MSLHDRLSEDLKTATKAKDQVRMDVIRMIKAAILNKELELKKHLDDAEMSRVMATLVKQRREAADQYQKANRTDLAARELREIVIIEGYLPKAPSSEEIAQVVEAILRETGARTLKDMGSVMKQAMARLAGQAVDGTQVSELVRARLQSAEQAGDSRPGGA
ncbi:GatB/YqeY domain-containing protein [Nitrospira sp. Kam-Ns4a]